MWVESLGEFGLVPNLLEGTGSLGMWSSQIPALASRPHQFRKWGTLHKLWVFLTLLPVFINLAGMEGVPSEVAYFRE